MVRLPLQTGAGALRDLAVSALAGGALVILGTWVGVAGLVANLVQFDVQNLIFALVGMALFALGVAAAVGATSSARNHRASDVVVGDDGLLVEGGRKGGVTLRWRDLDPAKCTLEDATTHAVRGIGTTRYDHALFITTGGDPMMLAETSEEDERASVEAILDVIRARTTKAPRPTAPAESLACGQCGAPTPLADAPSVPCPYCRAEVRVPEALRARMRDATSGASLGGALATKVERVLRQPGAARVNVLSRLFAALAWATVCAGVLVPWADAARAAVVPLACVAMGGFFVARVSIAGRRALRHVLLGFAARKAPDGTHACARCSAGLPTTASAIVRCVYCRCPNVLGVDFGSHVRRALGGHAEVEDVLAERARGRAFHGVLAVSMLALATMAAADPSPAARALGDLVARVTP